MNNCCVIIVNYNTGQLLKKTVESILDDKAVKKVLVIDNNSNDDSMESLNHNPLLDKLHRKENFGFANSCNFGAGLSDSEYVLFLNPDCILEAPGLSELIRNLQESPNAALAGCMILNPDGSEQRASRRRLPTFWRAVKTYSGIEKLARICNCFAGVNLSHQELKPQVQHVEAISGALMLTKLSVFREIGGFDEKFPMHFEDLDLFKRTLDAGFEIIFNPNVSAVHYQGTSSKTNPKVAYYKKLGLQRYFHKHSSKVGSFIVNMLSRFLR